MRTLFKIYPNRYSLATGVVRDGELESQITVTWGCGTVSDESPEEYNGPLVVYVYEKCPEWDDFNYIRSEERMLVEGDLLTGEEYASRLENFKWLRSRAWSLYEAYYDQETHHGILMGRFRPWCGSKQEAALLATIQSGYWPNWLEVGEGLEADLEAHLENIKSKDRNFGSTLWGGFFQPDEED
tara:strand:- start:319 stop:870 length:552 start_codon:yes stop_codon:yes gene_type:complete